MNTSYGHIDYSDNLFSSISLDTFIYPCWLHIDLSFVLLHYRCKQYSCKRKNVPVSSSVGFPYSSSRLLSASSLISPTPHLFAVSLRLIVEFSQVLVLMGLNEDGLIEFSVRWRCQQTLINQLIKWNVKLWIQNTLFKKITTEADDVKILKAHHL